MTEEIIIDCAFYKDGVCASPINKTCEYCKNIDVSKCYHKQLKRLEQKNKELNEKIIELSEEKGHLIVENNTLKEENEGLKIKHQRYRECSMQLNKKYKSALEEIRELAEKSIKISYNLEVNSMLYDIKDKIKEVLK